MIYRLEDICDIFDGPHATPHETQSGPIYLGIKNINEDCELDLSEIKHLSEEDYIKWTKRVVPQENDIVFSYEATLNRYALIPKGFNGCLGRRLAIARVKDNSIVNPHFLYHYFCSPIWNSFILANKVVGSTVLRVSIEDFPNYEVDLPDIDTQNKIARVLDSIISKRDNNYSICDDLKEMLKTLYRYWFIQFEFPNEFGKPYKSSGGKMVWNDVLKKDIPAGWELTNVSSLSQLYIDKREANFGKSKGSYRFFSCSKNIQYCDEYDFEGKSIVVANHGEFRAEFIDGKFSAYFCNAIFQPIKEEYYGLIYLSLDEYMPILQKRASGSIVKFISNNDIGETPILLPTHDFFSHIFNSIMSKIEKNMIENYELNELRDFLLQVLINGQVNVE